MEEDGDLNSDRPSSDRPKSDRPKSDRPNPNRPHRRPPIKRRSINTIKGEECLNGEDIHPESPILRASGYGVFELGTN